jgi:hypothetical protein
VPDSGTARHFQYVGPAEIRDDARQAPTGLAIRSGADLRAWCKQHLEDGWATYVVSLEGMLVLAHRRSEHVACAGGEAVLAAGEIRFDAHCRVVEVTNNSTGYCPPESCWPPVHRALAALDVDSLDAFTFVATFRRCSACGERNLVKDEWFQCAICGANLPDRWNFDEA